jgi:hypothetical protein
MIFFRMARYTRSGIKTESFFPVFISQSVMSKRRVPFSTIAESQKHCSYSGFSNRIWGKTVYRSYNKRDDTL